MKTLLEVVRDADPSHNKLCKGQGILDINL